MTQDPWIWLRCPGCGDKFAVLTGSPRHFCHRCHAEQRKKPVGVTNLRANE